MIDLLIAAFIIYVIAEFKYIDAFLDQRAALDIGRLISLDIRPMVADSTNTLRIIRIADWVSLSAVFYYGGWEYALGLIVVSLVVTTIYPVGESRYTSVMQKLETIDMSLAKQAKYALQTARQR